jgi:hypothetical protein
MFYRKINNASLWEKIQKLRELIKSEASFRKRICWNCAKELNIYDFMSDNIHLSPEYILRLWQSTILEFHCCDCFKYLKKEELENIENTLNKRYCLYCNKTMDIYQFSRLNNDLKLYELKVLWFDKNYELFCDNLCKRKYYKKYYDFLNKLENKI